MSIEISDPIYHDEDAARRYFETLRWPDGVVCPLCGVTDQAAPLNGRSMGPGWFYCGACKGKFTVRVGTVYERSHIPLTKWAYGFRMMNSSKKGVSAHQLHRTLNITYKSAWFMAHRIREAMADNGSDPIGGKGKTLEVDETFLGQQATVLVSGKGWQKRRGTGDMQKIVSLIERGGRARSIQVRDLKKDEIVRALASAARDSHLMTDQAQHYRRIGKEFVSHDSVDHGRLEYARREGDAVITTNTAEGFFSIFKRGMKGVYQHCGDRHLHRYLSEFDFRYSNRIALGVDDVMRTERAIKSAEGKRLTYRPTGPARALEA